MAFIALHASPDAGFAANITIDGEYRSDEALLGAIADDSVLHMDKRAETVVINDRKQFGSTEAPGLTQKLSLTAVAGGVLRYLAQTQVYLSVCDIDDPRQRLVIRLALTATAAQHDTVLGDFRNVVRTVHPNTGAG
ncbi:hypothetical protein [Streptomyces cucumeris]|uniref:hypothetical protein n=1 Tax=Streptomyces cucumeris TaxID=2962890 RepID=UPI003D74E2F4